MTRIGIAPENHERVFERFWQVDLKTDRPQTGTGLGLSVARQYARLLGGDLKVESDLGKGSLFSLWLPLAPKNE